MSKNRFYAFVIVCLLISNGILVFFMTQKNHRGKPPRSPKEIVIKRLKFDESQIAKYEILVQDHRKMTKELIIDINKNRESLYSNLTEQILVDSLIDPIAMSQAELEKLNYSHFQDIKSLCTPDQLDDFEELSKHLAKIFGMGKGKPMHGPKR